MAEENYSFQPSKNLQWIQAADAQKADAAKLAAGNNTKKMWIEEKQTKVWTCKVFSLAILTAHRKRKKKLRNRLDTPFATAWFHFIDFYGLNKFA